MSEVLRTESIAHRDDSPTHAGSLARLFSRRYLLVLAAVAGLVVVDQAIIQPLLVRLNGFAPAINVAGRQRMLSQKVAKEALALCVQPSSAESRRQALLATLDQWTASHRALCHGDSARRLKPVTTPDAVAALHELEPTLLAIREAAEQIAQAQLPETNSSQLQTILASEPIYLRGMERTVGLLEAAAGRQVRVLRGCGLAAMSLVLALLVVVHFHVLQPAVRMIRDQIDQLAAARDELEWRVARRTRALHAANDDLHREIAERQATEIRMRELSAQLAHASRVTALGQLATGLAHEINQPLGAIANYAETVELLLERPDPPLDSSRRAIVEIKRAALRAGSIVRRMRTFVRPSAPTPTRLDLSELVREVGDLCRHQLEQAGVRLQLDLASERALIEADSLEMQQVLVNLVQNSVQSLSKSTSDSRHVTIRTCVADGETQVEVIDSGSGFSGAGNVDPFVPFYTTKPDGLGMGLAISRSIVERHAGRMWARNHQGGGALVGFCLPHRPIHDESSVLHADSLCC